METVYITRPKPPRGGGGVLLIGESGAAFTSAHKCRCCPIAPPPTRPNPRRCSTLHIRPLRGSEGAQHRDSCARGGGGRWKIRDQNRRFSLPLSPSRQSFPRTPPPLSSPPPPPPQGGGNCHLAYEPQEINGESQAPKAPKKFFVGYTRIQVTVVRCPPPPPPPKWSGCIVRIRLWLCLPHGGHRLLSITSVFGASPGASGLCIPALASRCSLALWTL